MKHTSIAGPGAPMHIIVLERLSHTITMDTGAKVYGLRYCNPPDDKRAGVAIPGDGYIGMSQPSDQHGCAHRFCARPINEHAVRTTAHPPPPGPGARIPRPVRAVRDAGTGPRGRGRAAIPLALLEQRSGRAPWPGLIAAVRGQGDERAHVCWPRLPGAEPDFHQPESWAPLLPESGRF